MTSRVDMRFLIEGDDEDARIRVDTRYGYVSYSLLDRDKAFELYEESGTALRLCRDIYDDGVIIFSKEKNFDA